MLVCIYDPGWGGGGLVPCETHGDAIRKIGFLAIPKQTENARRRASRRLKHGSAPPGILCGHYVQIFSPISLRLLC